MSTDERDPATDEPGAHKSVTLATPAGPPRVLVIDDERALLRALERVLPAKDFVVETCDNGVEGLARLAHDAFDVVMVDIMMPQISGLDVLREVKRRHPEIEVIIMTAYATIDTAVSAIKLGAYDYLTKPFENLESVENVVRRCAERKRLIDRNRHLETQLDARERFEGMVGASVKMREVFKLVESVSYSSASVLIEGESGTGKELVAKAIHYRSPRKDKSFVVINCSALSETLLESELFGHVKGSFTGAIANKKGLFEVANGGTMFLDEIGEIPLSTQVKLLRVLQEGEVKRVGSNETVHVDVRIVAATNADLQSMMRKGTFREDLYYRLNVISVRLPPLRDRREDIPMLAYHFLKKYNARMGKKVEKISPEALALLQGYKWVGNVRELENVMERAVVLVHGDTVEPAALPANVAEATPTGIEDGRSLVNLPYTKAKRLALMSFEKRYLTTLLAKSGGNISRASREAGIDRSNFRRILKRYNLAGADAENDEASDDLDEEAGATDAA
jgi:two-component system response regulator HydG